jgi:methanogenic corrinoid protein MtbC1
VTEPAPNRSFDELRSRYLAAQLRGDRRDALAISIEALDAGYLSNEVQEHVIEAAQREIGRLWQENQISIADEHMATAISQLALAHLYDRAPRARSNGKQVVVACVEGELHDFPARLVADALDLAGFDVRYLGADVPTSSLLKMLEQDPPDLVALSVTMSFNLPALRSGLRAVRAATGPETPVAVGGNATVLENSVIEGLDADITGTDARALVTSACRVLGLEPPGSGR